MEGSDTVANTEVIKAFGESFAISKARDCEIVVRLRDKAVCYSKLCDMIGKYPFRKLIEKDHFREFVLNNYKHYNPEVSVIGAYGPISKSKEKQHDQLRNSTDYSIGPDAPIEESKKIEYDAIAKQLFENYRGGTTPEVTGTYGPFWMIDYVILNEDTSYYWKIHDLVNSIDDLAKAKNVRFDHELATQIRINEEKLRDVELKNKYLQQQKKDCDSSIRKQKHKCSRLEAELKKQTQLLEDMHKKLDTANNKLDTLTTTIENGKKEVVRSIDKMNKTIIAKVNQSNLTTATVKEHLIIYRIRSLTNSMRSNGKITNDQYALDVFRGQLTNEKTTMSRREFKFNPATDKRYDIGVTANAVDVFRYIKSLGVKVLKSPSKHHMLAIDRDKVTSFIDKLRRYLKRNIAEFQSDVNSNFNEIKDELYERMEIIEAENDAIIAEAHAMIVPDPENDIEDDVDMNCQYYYKHHYRKLNRDSKGYYFFIGSNSNRVREYVQVNDILSLRQRV